MTESKMEKKVRKKRKAEADEGSKKGSDEETEPKKQKIFCAETFRKELNRQNLVASLKEFLKLAKEEGNEYVITDYLEAGGSVQEMLLLLDETARSDLTSALPVFNVLHLLFLSIKSKESKFYAQAEDGAKFMLDSFIPTIEAMININSSKHRRAVLKVLTSIVTLFPSSGREIMNLIPSTPAVLGQFLQTQSGPDSVRKWFIYFILSFIMTGDNALIEKLMSMNGLLSSIIMDLKTDEADTICVFLSVVKQKILENFRISKTLKLKVFYTQAIVSLFHLYNWKETKVENMDLSKRKVIKPKIVIAEEKEMVTESVHEFLLVLCASKKWGVAFTDNTFGTAGHEKNNLLVTVVQAIPSFWENKKMSEMVIAIVVTCPGVMRAALGRTESVIQPRESAKWIVLMQFIINLLEAVSPRDIVKTAEEVTEINLYRLAKTYCTPSKLISVFGTAIRKNESSTVVYYSMKAITVMWRKTKEVLDAYKDNKKMATTLTGAYAEAILKVDEVLTIWETVCKLPKKFQSIEKVDFLNIILEYLDMCAKCQDSIVESPGRIAVSMLNAVDEIGGALIESDRLGIQSRIFYLLITADPDSVAPDTDLFKKGVTLLLISNNTETIGTVATMVLSTGVFENGESEIDIWLGCYFERFEEYRDSVPKAFADCVSRLYMKKVKSAESGKGSSELVVKRNLTESRVLKQFLKMLKGSEEVKDVRDYVSCVTFRLYHYYNKDNNKALMKFCEKHGETVAEKVLTYIKGGDVVEFVADGSEFVLKVERTLMTWLTKKKKQLELESVLSMETTYNFCLFLVFNTVTSYLESCVSSDSLSDNDVTKLSAFFSFFMGFGLASTPNTASRVLSHDVKDPCLLRRKCAEYLFSLPMMDKFDVCEDENETVVKFTKIITGTLLNVSKEDLRDLVVFQPWKRKILDTITDFRDKSRTMEVFAGLEPLLDRFSYTSDEVSEVLGKYANIKDLKTFFDDGRLTMSTMMMIKFLKLQCEFRETTGKCVTQLRNVMKSMMEGGAEDLGVLDECFVYLLKSKPKALSFLTNDFVEDLMRRSDANENTVTLCKLLLSDPSKTDHFIRFANENFKEVKSQKGIVIMSSVVVRDDEDSFLRLLKSRRLCRYWKESELVVESEASKLMKMVFKEYRKYICMEKTKKVEFVLQNQGFFAVLTKCFLDEERLLGMKDNILQGSFLPEIIHETVLKHKDVPEIVETYAKGLLCQCSGKLKDVENGTCDEEAWSKLGKYICDIVNLGKQSNWESLTNNGEWKDFVRISLRLCFNFPNCPSFLKTTRHFIELLYAPSENSRDVKNIFDMLISHSQFLNVMLQKSQLKRELVKLYYSLIKRNSTVLSVKHIPVILASYTGSLSENDVTLLDILRVYEAHDLNMNEYEPVVWGEPAIAHYSVKSNVGMSLWRRITMYNVLEMLDPKRMEESLEKFPVTRTGAADESVDYDENVYDPAFLLPIFTNLLSPGAVTYCLPFVQKACFAYTIRALSSSSREIRVSASVVLARLYNHLELVQMMKMKPVILHFINCLRYAIDDIEKHPVPSVVTYFLGKTSLELLCEPGFMFTPLQQFLLAKPVFNLDHIPEFLPLFHSSDVNYMKHRQWMLEIMRDGFRDNNDLDLLFRTMAVKMILSYFSSQFCSRELRPLVLEVVTNILKIPKSVLLISEYGFLTWLNGISVLCDNELISPFVKLLSATAAIIENPKLKSNLFCPIQLLNILMKFQPNLVRCRSVAVVESYLTILLDCLLTLYRHKHMTWCRLNRVKLLDLSDVIAAVTGGRGLADKYVKSTCYVSFCDMANAVENTYRKIAFLWNVLSGLTQ